MRTTGRYHVIQGRVVAAVALLGLSLSSGARGGESYYAIVFAFQGQPNLPRHAHTFATFIKATGEGPSPERYALEAHTLSWYPAAGEVRSARLLAERGVNLGLVETLRLARALGARITHWGPFQVHKELYDRALVQIARLESGTVRYKVLEGTLRPGIASNCIHAISDIDVDRGLLFTGTAYGEQASRVVVYHLRGWMIAPHRIHGWVWDRLGLVLSPRG